MPTGEQRERGRRRRRRRAAGFGVLVLAVVVGSVVVLWPRDEGRTAEENAARRACVNARDALEDRGSLYRPEMGNALRLIREEAERSDSPGVRRASEQLSAALPVRPPDRASVDRAVRAMDDACREEGVEVSG